MSERWTVGELLRWTTDKLQSLGIDDARVDAEHLLAHALDCRRVDLYLQHDRLLDESDRSGFRELVRRRLKREPVAYIEGIRGFHALDLELHVDPRVLIPRPETEHLVDWALELLQPLPAPVTHVVDVGTGSGAIALSMKRARPDLVVTGCDRSEDALTVARSNATRLDIDITWVRSDLLQDVAPPPAGWDFVLANLPYVASADMAALSPEVQHEPAEALDGGADGLDFIRALITQTTDRSKPLMHPRGWMLLEVGLGQHAAVEDLLRGRGFESVSSRKDLAGIERVVAGRWT